MSHASALGSFFAALNLLLSCAVPFALLLLGLLVGSAIERAHLRSLDEREEALLTIPVTDLRTVPPGVGARDAALVTGSVVVASDYLKTFLAKLRSLIGGEVRSFDRLMLRARREATCRLLAEAHRLGAVAVINVRYETSNIGIARKKQVSPMVEVIAYGTAVLP